MTYYEKVRPDILMSIRCYAYQHQPVSGFLQAVLKNDLVSALKQANDDNFETLPEIVLYCSLEIPSRCWGSPQKVKEWLKEKPLEEVTNAK